MNYYVYATLEGTFVLQAPDGAEARHFSDILEALTYVRGLAVEECEVTVFDAFGRVALSRVRISGRTGGAGGNEAPGGGDGS